jgi:hypothetical protein
MPCVGFAPRLLFRKYRCVVYVRRPYVEIHLYGGQLALCEEGSFGAGMFSHDLSMQLLLRKMSTIGIATINPYIIALLVR